MMENGKTTEVMTITEKKKSSLWDKLCVVLGILLAVVAAALLAGRMYLILPVTNYYVSSGKAFAIPGLSDNFVPQGLCYDDAAGVFLTTGYQKDHTASPVWMVNKDSKESRKVVLEAPDGSDFTGHAGGLSVLGNYVYVAGDDDNCLYVYSRDDILGADDGARVKCLGTFDTYFGRHDGLCIAFTTAHDGRLTVGEFYRDPNYVTPDSHKFTSPSGDYLQALAVTYEASDGADAVFGLRPVPVEAYALPDLVQGMAFYDGKIWLSTSYAVAFSGIYAYEQAGLQKMGTLPVEGGEMPLYALDSAAMTTRCQLPPMSEEIEFVDGRMYTMCESASNQYIFGKLTGGKWCYATDMDKMKNQLRQPTAE